MHVQAGSAGHYSAVRMAAFGSIDLDPCPDHAMVGIVPNPKPAALSGPELLKDPLRAGGWLGTLSSQTDSDSIS